MLRLPRTAAWWLLVHMVDGPSAAGDVCRVGVACERVGALGERVRTLVSQTTLTRDPAILTGCSVFLVLHVHVVSGI